MKIKEKFTKTGASVTEAVNAQFGAVGIGNLRVLIYKEDDGFWFAQGLEIDYGVQGDSLAEAKTNFEKGLALNISMQMQINGTIDDLLVWAPDWVLRKVAQKKGSIQRYAQITLHELSSEHALKAASTKAFPFEGITYLQDLQAA